MIYLFIYLLYFAKEHADTYTNTHRNKRYEEMGLIFDRKMASGVQGGICLFLVPVAVCVSWEQRALSCGWFPPSAPSQFAWYSDDRLAPLPSTPRRHLWRFYFGYTAGALTKMFKRRCRQRRVINDSPKVLCVRLCVCIRDGQRECHCACLAYSVSGTVRFLRRTN